MLPLASIRRHSSAQDTLCRSSVVRIHSSNDTPIFTAMSRKSAETLSVKDCGSMPASRAAFSTFWPCSSVPVRKNTSNPSSRFHRAITSAAIEV